MRNWLLLLLALGLLWACDNRDADEDDNPVGPLAAPSNLILTPLSGTTIQLTWNDNSTAEQGFVIDRRTDNSSWHNVFARVDGSVSTAMSYTDSLVQFGHLYTYRVYAYDSLDTSKYITRATSPLRPGYVMVAGGSFSMGSAYGDASALPEHTVTLSTFAICDHEVTQAEYDSLMNSNPADFSYRNHPVERVTWYNAIAYCNELSEADGLDPVYTINGNTVSCDWSADGYRLPTEAEWEYAARGGNRSGNYLFSGSNQDTQVGWFYSNSGHVTNTVKQKPANELGLYDMSGNVDEWCWDWFNSTYYSNSPSSNPHGPVAGSYRIRRGGSWRDEDPVYTVSRSGFYPSNRSNTIGFRPVRAIQH